MGVLMFVALFDFVDIGGVFISRAILYNFDEIVCKYFKVGV